MTQEYIALSVFLIAFAYSVFSILRYIVKFRGVKDNSCNGACNCGSKGNKRLIPGYVEGKSRNYKQVSLK